MRMYQIGIGLVRSTTHPTSVEHGYWEQKGLTSTLTDQGPYEFVVSGAGEDYIDLANTHLFVEAQITKADGSALDVDSDVGTRQFMDAPLIQRHKRQSQRKARIPTHSMYPYRAYLETLLRYGPAAKVLQLTGVVWNKDTPGFMDSREKKKTKDSEKD